MNWHACDDRYRLLTANRFESGGNVKAAYSYTYDDGDNMLADLGIMRSAARQWPQSNEATKAHRQPFFDDFNDGNYTGWSMSGTWTASNNMLETVSGAPIASKSNTDGDTETVLRYRINDTSDSLTRAYVDFRFVDWSNLCWVRIFPSQINIGYNASGGGAVLATGNYTSTANVWYNLRIVADGATVKVWRWIDGVMPTLVCSTTSAPTMSTTSFKIHVNTGYLFDFDDIRVLANSLSNTTTLAVNNANELTSMSDYNGSTTFGFDDWGRMTSKARSSYSASYGYRNAGALQSVTSTWPGEDDVSYSSGGDGKNRERTVANVTTKSRWNEGLCRLNEEASNGNLARTVVYGSRILADVAGTDPSTGDWRYYALDKLGTARSVYSQGKSVVGDYEFAPFGAQMNIKGLSVSALTASYSSQTWDQAGGFYYYPYREYNPLTSRWMEADPAGFVDGTNMFAFVRCNPASLADIDGRLLPALPALLAVGGGCGLALPTASEAAAGIALFGFYVVNCVLGAPQSSPPPGAHPGYGNCTKEEWEALHNFRVPICYYRE